MLKRYENGVLTINQLWPWPMDQRIRAALDLAGKNPDAIFGGAGKTLTRSDGKYLWYDSE